MGLVETQRHRLPLARIGTEGAASHSLIGMLVELFLSRARMLLRPPSKQSKSASHRSGAYRLSSSTWYSAVTGNFSRDPIDAPAPSRRGRRSDSQAEEDVAGGRRGAPPFYALRPVVATSRKLKLTALTLTLHRAEYAAGVNWTRLLKFLLDILAIERMDARGIDF